MTDKKPAKTKTKNPAVTPEAFVTAWQTSESIKQVVEKTGITEGSVRFRGSRYRKLGVGLKKFGRATAKLDVETLNKLATDLV